MVRLTTPGLEPVEIALANLDSSFGVAARSAEPEPITVDATAAADQTLRISTVVHDASTDVITGQSLTAGNSTLEVREDGEVWVLREDGTIAAGVAAPEAVDAAGAAVEARYEVRGSELVTVLESGEDEIAYPVNVSQRVSYVLLAGTWKNRPGGYSYGSGTQWSTRLSAWGMGVWTQGYVGNQTIRLQGWQEWVNGPGSTSTTVHQQYECHTTYGYAVWAAGVWWDFETARGSNPGWFNNPQKCNWP